MARKSNQCPKCGNPKDFRSRFCKDCSRTCPTVDHSKLDPQWLACFGGLFIGEGSLGVYFDRRARGSWHPRITIRLRADDKPVLDDVVEKLGGKVFPDIHRDSREWGWASTDTKEILEISKLILNNCPIPGKKLVEVQLMVEFCEWRLSKGYRVQDWSFGKDLADRLSRCKLYVESDQVISA